MRWSYVIVKNEFVNDEHNHVVVNMQTHEMVNKV